MRNYFTKFLFFLMALVLVSAPLLAQKKKKKNAPETEAPKPKKDEIKTIKEATKKSIAFDGLFKMFQDSTSGKVHLEINEEQLNKEYIYFTQIEDGVLDAGYFRGAYRGSKIFKINKRFNKIEFVIENTSFYFDPKNALSNSAKANINEPIILSAKIIAQTKNKDSYLIDATPLFVGETWSQIKPSSQPGTKPGSKFSLGSMSKDKSRIEKIKNYPENSDIIVQLSFENKYPVQKGGQAVTDARYTNIKMRHSLIEVPQNDYKPRYDDPRVGYFMTQVNDMTSVEATNYRDLVHRWNLVKKDPTAAISEPVEPITWWIENSTPVEIRDAVRDGVLEWNKAFESAGFKNAVVVNIQPDDAEWDAGDIRYNVLRWTSSPRPPFGGYGPSFVNPRTGQILGADIMLEYTYLTYRMMQEDLFDLAGLSLMDEAESNEFSGQCSFGDLMHNNTMFGTHALSAMQVPDTEKSEFLKQSIYRLSLHEVGHTLGLNHNMQASQLHDPVSIHDKQLGLEIGVTSSVMDYPAPNISLDRSKQGLYFDVMPGPYDHWAITFGYKQTDEAGLKKILARSTEKELAFGNDADDMRSAGRHIDPRVMIGDLSSDPVAYAEERIKLIEAIYPKLIEKYSRDERSYHDLRNAYYSLTGQYGISLRVMTRQIGGVYVDRSFAGQEEADKPFTPVPYTTQKNAMKAIAKYGFGTKAFNFPEEINNYLLGQRRGFNHFGNNEDPKFHDRILRIQQDMLNHLTHANVLKRLTDSKMYGNSYSLSEYMTDLTNSIFRDDLRTSVKTIRQNVQIEYANRLAAAVQSKSSYDNISKSMAMYELRRIDQLMRSASSPNISTRAHRAHVRFIIEKALDTNS